MRSHGKPPGRAGGLAALAVASALIAQLCLTAVVFRTQDERVYLLNHPIPETCGWRAHTGLPCPACGWTRGVVLTLHGNIRAAWSVNPGGPLTVFGIAGSALVLVVLSGYQRRRGSAPARFAHFFATGLAVYAAGAAVLTVIAWSRILSSS